jgi:UDP-GlcNAc3NAcA epimerase
MKIVTVIGARPQFIKAATVSRILLKTSQIKEIIIHTGQHYDNNMSKIFFDELCLPKPNYNLEVGSASHGKQTGLMLERIEKVLIKEKPDWILIYGDTNSTLAGALAAAKLHMSIAHIEAGLRSFNRKMPEEINRIVADHIAQLLFAPTQNAFQLLCKEGLQKVAEFSGDVMFDSVLYYKNLLTNIQPPELLNSLDKYYLSTIHRPENTDNINRLYSIFSAFGELSYPVVLPLHPRTKSRLNLQKISTNIHIIEPTSYLQMLYLLQNCIKVLTDSGGLQKEAYFMEKICITLRDQTEWIETLENGWNYVTSANKKEILSAINREPNGPRSNAFGDGHAAEKIVQKLIEFSEI